MPQKNVDHRNRFIVPDRAKIALHESRAQAARILDNDSDRDPVVARSVVTLDDAWRAAFPTYTDQQGDVVPRADQAARLLDFATQAYAIADRAANKAIEVMDNTPDLSFTRARLLPFRDLYSFGKRFAWTFTNCAQDLRQIAGNVSDRDSREAS